MSGGYQLLADRRAAGGALPRHWGPSDRQYPTDELNSTQVRIMGDDLIDASNEDGY